MIGRSSASCACSRPAGLCKVTKCTAPFDAAERLCKVGRNPGELLGRGAPLRSSSLLFPSLKIRDRRTALPAADGDSPGMRPPVYELDHPQRRAPNHGRVSSILMTKLALLHIHLPPRPAAPKTACQPASVPRWTRCRRNPKPTYLFATYIAELSDTLQKTKHDVVGR